MVALLESTTLWPWRPIYWEPVSGTGERIMVGVAYSFGSEFRAVRTIRKDVLECLFGRSASGLVNLIDESIKVVQLVAAESRSLESVSSEVFGLIPGELRQTAASSAAEILETACLLYSSLVNLDKLDDLDENDAPQQEDVNRRFGTEVRTEVLKVRPDLSSGFGATAQLIAGGQAVKFGFSSHRAIIHFTVLHPVRHNSSLRDARAKLFELQRAREISGIPHAALIAATPRQDDPTLGSKQRDQLRVNQIEIEKEADAVDMRWYPAHSAADGATKLIQVAG